MMVAEYNGEKKLPADIPNDDAARNTCGDESPLRCPKCSEPVTHRNESTSMGRAAHFAHCPESAGGCDGHDGETPVHVAMKHNAVSAVERVLPDDLVAASGTEVELPAPVSSKENRQTDALVEFCNHDTQLGDALAIETQHQNKKKHPGKTTADYITNENLDISVLWLWQEDFDTSPEEPERWVCEIEDERELRDRVRRQIWPASGDVFEHIEDAPELPSDGSVWERRGGEEESHRGPNSPVPSMALNGHVGAAGRGHRFHTFAAYYQTTHVDEYSEDNAASCPATLPPGAIDEIAQNYKESHDWGVLFRAERAKEHITGLREQFGLPAGAVPVTIPAQLMEKMATRHTLRENSKRRDVTERAADPTPPPTPFEDIQCRGCGAYWWKYDEKYGGKRDYCTQCGEPVDMSWNLRTGRISEIPYVPINEYATKHGRPTDARADGGEE